MKKWNIEELPILIPIKQSRKENQKKIKKIAKILLEEKRREANLSSPDSKKTQVSDLKNQEVSD